jgi:hypothetical protein
MLRNKSILGIVLMSTGILFLSGCYKDKTVILDTTQEITRTVSYTNDIIPIFNNSCNISGCHNTGGKSPDLSTANSFNALSGGGFINTGDPVNSELYLWMTGKRGTPMPVGGINKEYNALVLAWIKQGANNN